MQRIGLDAKEIFASNPDISLINLGDAMAFLVKMVQAGIKNIKDYNPHKAQVKFAKAYGKSPHHETIQMYVHVLEVFGFVTIEDGLLTFKRIKSQNNDRNYLIEVGDQNIKIKKLGREISKFIFSSSMRAIEYVKQLIRRRNNPQSHNDLKRTEGKLRRLGFDAEKFVNHGVSYNLLCSRYHICKHTVSEFIKKCEKSKIFTKLRNIEGICIFNATRIVENVDEFLRRNFGRYTFYEYFKPIDELHLYTVKANTYLYNTTLLEASLSSRI